MVTFKRGWDKLYYTQHTFLRNVGQLPILFFLETNTDIYIQERGKSGNKMLGQKCPPLMFKKCGGFCHFIRLICLFPPIISCTVFVFVLFLLLLLQFFTSSFFFSFIILFPFTFFFSFVTYLFFHHFFPHLFWVLVLSSSFFIIFIFIYLCYFLMKCPSIYNF